MGCTDANRERLREGEEQFCASGFTNESNGLTYPLDVVSGRCNHYIGSQGRNKKGQRIQYTTSASKGVTTCPGGDLRTKKYTNYVKCIPPSPKGCPVGNQAGIPAGDADAISPAGIAQFFNGKGIIDNSEWGTTPSYECPNLSWSPNTDVPEFQGNKLRTFVANPYSGANPGLLRYVTWKNSDDKDGSTLCIYDGSKIQPKDLDNFKGTDGYEEAGRYACLINNRTTTNCPTYSTEDGQIRPRRCHILAGTDQDSPTCREWATSGGNKGWDSGGNKLLEEANNDIKDWCNDKDPVKQPECGCIQRTQSDIYNTLFSSNPGALWQWYIPCGINNQNLVPNKVRKQGEVKNVCEQVINIANNRDSNISLNNVRQVTKCDVGGGGNGGNGGNGFQDFIQRIKTFFQNSAIIAWSIVGGIVLLIVVVVALFLF